MTRVRQRGVAISPVVRFAVALFAALGCACVPKNPGASEVTPTLAHAGEQADPLAILDELDLLIAEGKDTEEDRVFAYQRVRSAPDDHSAGYAFARGALAGRVAELRGVKAGKLVTEAEAWARKSLERDPDFRDGAAKRMLGTLYVMAPGRLVEHGDAEDGLTMLEELVAARPDDPRNHLRLAEAYVYLGDPDPGIPFLCRALRDREAFRRDEQKLLDALVAEVGGEDALGCAAGGGG